MEDLKEELRQIEYRLLELAVAGPSPGMPCDQRAVWHERERLQLRANRIALLLSREAE